MPRSKEQFQDMREKSKKLIMESALTLFATEGFHKTSISRIAKECGVATGLLYNYFESKEQLLEEIIHSGIRDFAETMHRQADAGNMDLADAVRLMFRTAQENTTFWKLCFSVLMQPELRERGNSMFQGLFAHVNGTFEEYFRAHGRVDAEKRAKAVGGLIHGTMVHFMLTGEEDVLETVQEAIIEVFLEEK